jgi:hypothetical protein
MPRRDVRGLFKAFAASFALLAFAVLMWWLDAPALAYWIFALLGVLGLFGVAVGFWRPMPSYSTREMLKTGDGRFSRVDLADGEIVVTRKATGEVRRIPWSEITEVYVIALDGIPVGGMSFMVHRDSEVTEIPSDSEGNEAFLRAMQDRLPGFDNEALIEVSAMLQGFKQLWKRT